MAPVWPSKGLNQAQLNLGLLKLYKVTIMSTSCPQASDARNYPHTICHSSSNYCQHPGLSAK